MVRVVHAVCGKWRGGDPGYVLYNKGGPVRARLYGDGIKETSGKQAVQPVVSHDRDKKQRVRSVHGAKLLSLQLDSWRLLLCRLMTLPQ